MMRSSVWRAAVAACVLLLVQPSVAGPARAAGDEGVAAWGDDASGQLGDGGAATNRSTPVGVSGLGAGAGVVAVSAGWTHSLALGADGSVLAWGGNGSGQLGDGGPILPYDPDAPARPTPAPVRGLGPGSGVIAVAAGAAHSLALLAGGTVLAWGEGYAGQLGDGSFGPARSTPVAVRGLGPGSGVVAVSAGANHNLALRADGSVLAWGDSYSGQVGDGSRGTGAERPTPVPVAGLGAGSGVVAVSAGANHSLALRAEGTVLAWGSDRSGQLGDGDGSRLDRPVPRAVGVGAGSQVVGVSAGGGHSLAVQADGGVLAWGANAYGQLGEGSVGPGGSVSPVPVGGARGAVAVAAGGSHSLALRADGSVVAWGRDASGQLGDGGAIDDQVIPVPVSGFDRSRGVGALAAGLYHSLAAIRGEQQGYALVGADGAVFTFGTARFWGSTGGLSLNQPVVGMSYTATGLGYALVASDGGIFGFGDFQFYGSTGGVRLNQPIVGMATTPSGEGYWLVAADGGIFAYGDARFLGSTGGIRLNQPVVGMERTPSGEGYWLVASDGGIFAYGDARFLGSTGGITLNRPIMGMARSTGGAGYLLVASDGGIFNYGDAPFLGSAGGRDLSAPIVEIMADAAGRGYWLCGRDGEVLPFGNAQLRGSLRAARLPRPVVGCDAAVPPPF